MMDDMAEAKRIAAGLKPGVRRVIVALGAEFASAPQGVTRQLVASAAMRQSQFIEVAHRRPSQPAYYRLKPLGLAVRAALPADPSSTGERGE